MNRGVHQSRTMENHLSFVVLVAVFVLKSVSLALVVVLSNTVVNSAKSLNGRSIRCYVTQ